VAEILETNSHESVTSEASLRGKVFTRLENDILNGRYLAGDSFTESRVAAELGVSRTPVREAIRQLELEGLVTYVPNKGATVEGLSEEDIRDIGEIRTKIEGIAARRASVSISPDQLTALQEILALEAFHTGRGEAGPLLQLDTRFHEIIFQASGSRLLNRTLKAFHHYIQRARSLSLQNMERAGKTLSEHGAILSALQGQDADRAETLMVQHVRNATRNISRLQSAGRTPE
jgi:DNA-binding GntR family transcriptional regulator